MTAEPMTIADDAEVSVVAVRSFLGKHRRRSWVDWYVAGFVLLIVAIYGSNFLVSPLGSPSRRATQPRPTRRRRRRSRGQA